MWLFFKDSLSGPLCQRVQALYDQCSDFYSLTKFDAYEEALLRLALKEYKSILDECIKRYDIDVNRTTGYEYLSKSVQPFSSLKIELLHMQSYFGDIKNETLYDGLKELTQAFSEVLSKAHSLRSPQAANLQQQGVSVAPVYAA